MTIDIIILHERKPVGEAITWSLRFAYDYNAVYIKGTQELMETLPESTIILSDIPNFWKMIKVCPLPCYPVIVLVDDLEKIDVVEVLTAGATAVVDLSRGPEAVIEKIQKVLLPSNDDQNVVIKKLVHQQLKGKGFEDSNSYNLTVKEKEILKLLRDGMHLKLIAQNTGTTYETVRTHMKHIYKKIGVMSVSEAVIKAMKMNL